MSHDTHTYAYQPMDTVKSRIQIKQATEQTSIFKMFVEVLKEEGVRGLYRGTCRHLSLCVSCGVVCRVSNTDHAPRLFRDWTDDDACDPGLGRGALHLRTVLTIFGLAQGGEATPLSLLLLTLFFTIITIAIYFVSSIFMVLQGLML